MFQKVYIKDEMINIYADIDAYSQCKLKSKKSNFTARNMGKNDLWIVSTAIFLKSTLINTDNDFNHLSPDFIEIISFDTNLN